VGPHICALEGLAGVDGPEPERSSQLPKIRLALLAWLHFRIQTPEKFVLRLTLFDSPQREDSKNIGEIWR